MLVTFINGMLHPRNVDQEADYRTSKYRIEVKVKETSPLSLSSLLSPMNSTVDAAAND